MADRYLDSSGSGTAASPWETYNTDEAKTLLTFDAVALAVNETIWVGSGHSENIGAATLTMTASSNATPAAPQRVICVSDIGTNATPVTSPTATFTQTGNYAVVFEGHWYLHGLIIDQAHSGNAGFIAFGRSAVGPHNITVSLCKLISSNNIGSNIGILLGNAANAGNDETKVRLNNCVYKCSNASTGIRIAFGQFRINGLTLDSAGSTPTSLFIGTPNLVSDTLVENSDLTGESFTNFVAAADMSGLFRVRNCKLPSGAVLCTSTDAPGFTFMADDVTVGTTYVPFYRRYYAGEVKHETTIIPNTSGDRFSLRDDASEQYSIKLESTTATYWEPLYSDWIHINVEDTSTAITPYAEILVTGDGASALTDRECWIEVDAKTVAGTSNHEADRYDDRAALVASGTAQSDGTITWTGHGYTTPRTHKLALGSSITPTQYGYIRVRVGLAKSTSIYIGKVGV